MRQLLVIPLLACACGGDPPQDDVVAWDPCGRGDAFEVRVGEVERERAHLVTRWFGRSDHDAPGESRPTVLGDTRDALLVRPPTQFAVALPARDVPWRLRTAVLRRQVGRTHLEEPVRCDVFFEPEAGGSPVTLASVLLPGGSTTQAVWSELTATVEAGGAGSLSFVARLENAAITTPGGARVAWAAPLLTRVDGAAPDSPDVVLVTVDTLRADALAHAPRLSALVARGSYWARAVSPSTWTLPSYASLFSGLDADAHGAGRAALPAAVAAQDTRDFRGLALRHATLAERYRAAGYATAMFHQNPFLEPWTGIDRGFERYVRSRESTETALGLARDWWEAERARPRFLVLHLMAPHLPYAPVPRPGVELPPDPLAERDWGALFASDHTPSQRRAFFDLAVAERDAVRTRYAAEVAALDASVAPWLEVLLAGDRAPLIAFHSDHGEEHWDDGSFEHGHSFTAAVARVPLALIWPGHIAASRRSEAVAVRDLGPTLLRLSGVPGTLGADGDLFRPGETARCLGTLYRSEHGGLEVDVRSGERHLLPLADAVWAEGPEAELSPELRADLASLGYVDDAD